VPGYPRRESSPDGAGTRACAGDALAHGADMSWDQAIAYTLTQITQALNELESRTQP
jgi:hypothetical protein